MAKKKNNAFRKTLTQMIVDIFEKSGNKALNYKQIAGKLQVTDSLSKDSIRHILDEESRAGGVFRVVDKSKYVLKELRPLVTGKVDLTSDGSAFIVTDDELEDDIYIAPRKLRQALHGDTVKVHTYEKSRGRRKEGEVVEILQRARTEFTGIIHVSPRFAFFIADNRKMLHDIFIPLDALNNALDGDKVVVGITDWPADSKNPVGVVKHVLGKQGENNTEMNAILADFGFPLAFPKAVETEANEIPAEISHKDLANRRDFRGITTFTIDPADAKDFDDAISYQKLENGLIEVGVHIADVTHYVREDQPLDQEAFQRGTSVYLVDRVIPMLPERLSNDLCSLKPNVDRLAFSAVMQLDSEGTVIEEWFGKTVIHSNRRYSYEEAQEILESGEGDYAEELKTLNSIAYELRAKKFKNGAINFESTEVKFILDESGKPLGVYTKERKDAHKLIEDFMLLANRRVAEFIGKQGKGKQQKTFVYRSHDVPNTENLQAFAQFAARFGHKFTLKSDKENAKNLNQLMHQIEGTKEQNVLTSLAIRSMAKAIYTTKKTSHYGLSFQYYTHFTSPIRRYPDVMVHRLLQHYLDGGQPIPADPVEQRCEHSSQMEKRAADAERASVKYKQAEFLKDQVGQEFTGIISGVTEWGMYVEIQENKCEGMVRLRDITDDFYALDEKNYAIIGQRRKKKYQLGDDVQILVKKVDLAKRQIDFTLA